MGPTILFTYLKFILLQYFQFSVSATINSIQTDPIAFFHNRRVGCQLLCVGCQFHIYLPFGKFCVKVVYIFLWSHIPSQEQNKKKKKKKKKKTMNINSKRKKDTGKEIEHLLFFIVSCNSTKFSNNKNHIMQNNRK